MAGVEVLALYVAITFFFVSLGYFAKNKYLTFAGGSLLLIFSLILLGFGYDIPAGQQTTTNYTIGVGEGNVTEHVFQDVTYEKTNDAYSYAFGTILLLLSLFMLFELLRGDL